MLKEQIQWTEEAEVVVVGYGGAGAVTAIAAHNAGARVLILEKQLQDTEGCTNHTPSTRMSGGGFIVPEDTEKAITYFKQLRRIAGETIDEEEEAMIRVLCKQMETNIPWLESIGAVIGGKESMSPSFAHMEMIHAPLAGSNAVGIYDSDFPELAGAEAIRVFWVANTDNYRGGAALFKALTGAVEQRGIPVLWGAAGEHLILDEGDVVGVRGVRGGRAFAVKATRGVVLTCGGFEHSEFYKRNYLRPSPIHFYGNPANAGEGITMGLEAGASLWHMNSVSWRAVMKFPDHPIAFGTQHHSQMGIFVDQKGSRFSNERYKSHAFGYELTAYHCFGLCYPRVPIFWIFDEKRRTLGSLASKHGACNPPDGKKGAIHYAWSEDNQTEIDRGWIIKADTLDELALKLAADPDSHGLMDAEILAATVARYNRFCEEGEDLDFHRSKSGLQPLEDPPYYAVKLWPGGPNTQGGPQRNVRCQVVHPDGTPVPRLYSCGELGSFFSMLYNGGGNLAECLGMGRIAGENVAGESIREANG